VASADGRRRFSSRRTAHFVGSPLFPQLAGFKEETKHEDQKMLWNQCSPRYARNYATPTVSRSCTGAWAASGPTGSVVSGATSSDNQRHADGFDGRKARASTGSPRSGSELAYGVTQSRNADSNAA